MACESGLIDKADGLFFGAKRHQCALVYEKIGNK